MLRFNKTYFLFTLALFIIEVCIAIFIHDAIIRPYIGDLLVVIPLYCFFKSFLNLQPLPLAIGVLLFSYVLETLQYFNIVELLGLQQNRFARTVIGTSFAWTDIVMYSIGITIVLLIEKYYSRHRIALTKY
jgi:presenilin-like A22 family membrane protease